MTDLHDRASTPTVVRVRYPEAHGTIGLRGSAPLSWEETYPPSRRSEDFWLFELDVPEHELVELKLVRNDDDWQAGRNYVVHAGDHLDLSPYFDDARPVLLEPATVGEGERALSYRVLLPPGYGEQITKRYPTLYVLDGQSMWTTSEDPFGVWNLDATLASLFELHAMEEVIVVAIDTSVGRADRLSPVPGEGGAGNAATLLADIVEQLVPHIDQEFRTSSRREDRAIMGSSMGGLFAFFATWKRSDIFGKGACLSSSFWWADRWMVKEVAQGPAPSLKAKLYLDSGAAMNPDERDPSLRDGFHHTRSMYRALLKLGYVAGQNLHRLTFAGESHDASAWAARVAIPLQLLFPKTDPPGATGDSSIRFESAVIEEAGG